MKIKKLEEIDKYLNSNKAQNLILNNKNKEKQIK